MKIKFIIVALSVFALSSFEVLAQADDNVVIIRVQEVNKGGDLKSKMVIIKPDSNVEEVPLEEIGIRNDPAGPNGIKIKEEIAKWRKLGYNNIAISSGGDFTTSRTIIILSKN